MFYIKMRRLILVVALFSSIVPAALAQQVIAKGSWKLEDNGTPFTIWGSYPSSAACTKAYPGVLASAQAQVAQAQSQLDAINNAVGTAAYTPDLANAAYATWSQLNEAEQQLEGAVCIQQ